MQNTVECSGDDYKDDNVNGDNEAHWTVTGGSDSDENVFLQ